MFEVKHSIERCKYVNALHAPSWFHQNSASNIKSAFSIYSNLVSVNKLWWWHDKGGHNIHQNQSNSLLTIAGQKQDASGKTRSRPVLKAVWTKEVLEPCEPHNTKESFHSGKLVEEHYCKKARRILHCLSTHAGTLLKCHPLEFICEVERKIIPVHFFEVDWAERE